MLLEAVLRYESLYLHASKFRLGRRTTAPNNIKAAVPKAGFLELFDILVRGVAMIILSTYNIYNICVEICADECLELTFVSVCVTSQIPGGWCRDADDGG